MSKKSRNTMTYTLIPTDQYLSGDVRRKLYEAETAASINPIFLHNVARLETVQPTDIPIVDIDTAFSSIWIPLRFFEAFIQEVLEVECKVRYSEFNSAWNVESITDTDKIPNTSTYGVEWTGYTLAGNQKVYRLLATEMIELAMNFKSPSISRRETDSSPSRRDPNLTAGAIDKISQLQDRFTDWLRSDIDRRQELERLYNHKFNNLKLPTFDGGHLTFPGMSQKWRDRMRRYQANAIHRGMMGNLGAFLEVGLGKTLIGQAICMERKRLDPTTKSVVIVKKSTLRQFGNAFREAYPRANLLIATSADCHKGNRKLFMARVAAGNWDAVVMTHQAFEKLPLKSATLRKFIEPLLQRVRSALAEYGIECDEDSNNPRRNTSYIVRNLERMRNRLKHQLEQAVKGKDRGMFFEDLGLNLIVADEADVYLNAPLLTKLQGIAGLSLQASGIATDFEWKLEWLRKTHGGGRVILKTGTFLRNTMANLYVMQKFLQPEMLEARGIHCFDAWASLFGRLRTGAEVTTDGGIARKTRFAEFVNLPELLQMFFSVAEIKRFEDVESDGLTRPTAKYVNVLAPMSEQQRQIMNDLVVRSIAIRNFNPRKIYDTDPKTGNVRGRDDNLLWVTTDGRKASLDARLVIPGAEDFYKSKINICARRVLKIWRKTQAARSVQMVFLDMSTPASPTSIYRDLRIKWIQAGIPIEEIAFIQDYQTDDQKAELFDQLNRGIKRIVIGSTPMMGVGVNVQAKLIALHHIDCTWRPCDLEQREGRILRSGNENNRVLIYRYVTQGVSGNCGFDSFMWQLVEAKLRFIRQIMAGDMTIRRMTEDASEDPTFSAAEVKALATGDIRIMRHVEVEAKIETLLRLEKSIMMDIDTMRHGRNSSIPWSRSRIKLAEDTLRNQITDFDLARANFANCTGEAFNIRLYRPDDADPTRWVKQDYTDRKAAGEVLLTKVHALLDSWETTINWTRVGYYAGMELLMKAVSETQIEALLRGPSQYTYSVKFVRDKDRSASRIESACANILKIESDAHYDIEYHNRLIVQFNAELERKQTQLGNVRSQVQEFSLEKSQLESALGLDKENKNAVVEIGETDD